MRAQVRKGFTLVEILIVVVILGILAAIVVPQFTSATQDAQGGNLQTQIETINNQLSLFRARTGANNADLDALFAAANPWEFLITGGTLPSSGLIFEGNYLKAPPRNPRFTDPVQRSAIMFDPAFDPATGVGGAANVGWYYYNLNGTYWVGASYFNSETGQIDPEMY